MSKVEVEIETGIEPNEARVRQSHQSEVDSLLNGLVFLLAAQHSSSSSLSTHRCWSWENTKAGRKCEKTVLQLLFTAPHHPFLLR